MRPVGRIFSMRFAIDLCIHREFDPREGDVLLLTFRDRRWQLCRVITVKEAKKYMHLDCVIIDVLEDDGTIYRQITT